MRFLITLALLVASIQSHCQEASSSSVEKYSGFFKKHDTEMPVRDAYALWDKNINRVVVYLLPEKINTDVERKLRTQDPYFIISQQPSPDKKKWQWYPYSKITMDFDGKNNITKDSLKTFAVSMQGIEKKGWGDNHHWRKDPNQYNIISIKVDASNGTPALMFSSKYKYHKVYPDDGYWDFSIVTPLISGGKIDLSNL